MSEQETQQLDALFDCDDAFSELGAPQAGDAALLERTIGSSMAAAPTGAAMGASGGLSATWWSAIIAAMVVVVVALAWPSPDVPTENASSPVEEVAPPVVDAHAPEAEASEPRVATSPPPVASVSSTVPPASVVEPPVPVAPVPARPQRTAAELLEQANAARKAGRTPRALSLYGQLFKAYPRSREAQTARVSAGRLHMDGGKPKAALSQFRKYLSAAPRGSLAEEAAAGRATALGRLGRAEAERDAWTELLEKHPGSVHSARAKKRIAELSGD